MKGLEIEFCGKKLKNPIVAASGTFGFGREYGEIFDVSLLGGICGKGLTLEKRKGNSGIRVWETPSGMMNSVGLENPGVHDFLAHEWAFMKSLNTQAIINVGGSTKESYEEACTLLDAAGVDFIELNISCPNVKAGGMAFGMEPDLAYDMVQSIRPLVKGVLMVKLSPNARDISEVAKACEAAGADSLSLVNTFKAMAVDVENKKMVFDHGYAGLSGPAILPIALRMVHEVRKAVSIPIMGMGGIMSVQDVLAFMMAGADAVQIGTGFFTNPTLAVGVIEGLEAYVQTQGLSHIKEIVNIL